MQTVRLKMCLLKDELHKAFELLNRYEALSPERKRKDNVEKGNGFIKSSYDTFLYNDISRVERAFLFVHSARNSFSLPKKIAMYIAALETLFSKDGSELSHKVAERVAFYLGGIKNEKMYTYRKVKVLMMCGLNIYMVLNLTKSTQQLKN